MLSRVFVLAAVMTVVAALSPSVLWAADLTLGPKDLRIEQSTEGGYLLTVRRKEGVGSVLLVESTEHPERATASFALRNPNYHPLNGDERRILDGEFLEPREDRYFIVSSTPVEDEEFGEAFVLFIPYMVEFGYPWSREGEIMILDGAFLNVRTFELPYTDYRGAFADNPFVLRVEQPEMVDIDLAEFIEEAVEAFEEISEEFVPIEDPADLPDALVQMIQAEGPNIDVVLVIDTTGSMNFSIAEVQKNLVPMLREILEEFESYRVGITMFRDYNEEYLTRALPFTSNLDVVQRNVNALRAVGGRDIPEAVYEGLYAGLRHYDWEAESRLIILVGDAPPHPRPRGAVTKDMVFSLAEELGVRINSILLPHP
ncbi:MAG: VWA domain-containing protein [Spirochaetaceae bacterium]|nr:MAG: VWA domain-containing protein [Spirochaetaceae bacterium]